MLYFNKTLKRTPQKYIEKDKNTKTSHRNNMDDNNIADNKKQL